MIGHMRHGSPPRLMVLQSIRSPNRRKSSPTPSAGVRMSQLYIGGLLEGLGREMGCAALPARAVGELLWVRASFGQKRSQIFKPRICRNDHQHWGEHGDGDRREGFFMIPRQLLEHKWQY